MRVIIPTNIAAIVSNRRRRSHLRFFLMPSVVGAIILMGASKAVSGVHYVDVKSANPTPPFNSWATASVTIQDAVDAAVAGDEVVVTNGVYSVGESDALEH